MKFNLTLKPNTKINKPLIGAENGWAGDFAEEMRQEIMTIDSLLEPDLLNLNASHPLDITIFWYHDSSGNVYKVDGEVIVQDNIWLFLSGAKKDLLKTYLQNKGFTIKED